MRQLIVKWLLASAAPFALLEILALLNGAPREPVDIARHAAIALTFCGLSWAVYRINWSRRAFVLGAATLASGTFFVMWPHTLAAWVVVLTAHMWLAALDYVWIPNRRIIARTLVAFLFGAALVAASEVQGRFSNEEFYSAVQALELGLFLALVQPKDSKTMVSRVRGSFPERVAQFLAVCIVLLIGSYVVVRAYQDSFYSEKVPSFEGISAENPSLCGVVNTGIASSGPSNTFSRLAKAVEANPAKGSPEYGMLAIVKRDTDYASSFRQVLLSEARAGNYTGPAGSVKYGQTEAALRAHFYSRVRAFFPGLFTEDDQRELADWFAAINRRAMTIEWVDVLYGIAFNGWPRGPYENQENGVGLLSVLETTGLHDPVLAYENRAYLDAHQHGWAWRFRNTDDSFGYQALWLTNAKWYADYALTPQADANRKQAFEWLLEQTLPDGAAENYNPPGRLFPAPVYYLGAMWLHDPRFMWLSNAALDSLDTAGRYLTAQPFIEDAVSLPQVKPAIGSCLLYGSSGLPTQDGPLAPDKIVLRDGWDHTSRFMLLNLRFSGWHRYKATGTVIALDQAGPLVREAVEPELIGWLPRGRSALRDKRILREQLNGLQVEADGLAGVFASLGLASRWAQDPPTYARVAQFDPDARPQVATTAVDDWHGWHHTRTILWADGIIVVVDDASGGRGHAAVTWHVTGDGARDGEAIWLRKDKEPAQMVLISDRGAQVVMKPESSGGASGQSVVYYAPDDGRLQLTTVFLTGQWVGAQVVRSEQSVRVVGSDGTRIFNLDRP